MTKTNLTVTDLDQNSTLERSLARWLFDFADFGILITDCELATVYVNRWFARSAGMATSEILRRNVFDVFPDLQRRGFDRYYEHALSGEARILSHRFHGYLFPMDPPAGSDFAQMQQTAQISPLLDGETVIGTITVIEDVSERVLREAELHFQIEERNRLLDSEISARELAEENERLKDTFDALKIEGAQLLELGRERDMLMHRIIAGQEEERKRIARNIHDHLGQQLTALRFALSLMRQQAGTDNPDFEKSIVKAQSIAEKLDQEVDYLSWELRPAEIDDIGLEEALKTLIREWTRHYGIDVKFHCVGMTGTRLERDTEINLYRIVQEALTNTFKHAGADRVVIFLERRDSNVVLIVEDNGVGFDVAAKEKISAVDRGMGIFGMYERAALVGGRIEIESKPAHGTSIFVRVPVA